MSFNNKLKLLLSRCSQPIYRERADIELTSISLLLLAGHCTSHGAIDEEATAACRRTLLHPLRRFYRRDVQLAEAALQTDNLVSSSHAAGGSALDMLLRALPLTEASSDVFQQGVAACMKGLQTTAWRLADIHSAISTIARRGEYDESFINMCACFVMQRASQASVEDLPHIAATVATLPELRVRADVASAIVGRTMALGKELTPLAIGKLSTSFNSLRYPTCGEVAQLFQEHVDEVAEGGDMQSCVQLFLFISWQREQFVKLDAIPWLVERICGETLDAKMVSLLCRALGDFSKGARRQLHEGVEDLLAVLSARAVELLEVPVGEGGLAGADDAYETFTVFLPRFLHLRRIFEEREAASAAFLNAVDSCADYVLNHLEAMMDSDNPPVALILPLLEGQRSKTCEAGRAILREASKQCVYLSALQTFQAILLLGDDAWSDNTAFRYLRNQFAKTSAGIPPTQMCAALRSLHAGCATSKKDWSEAETKEHDAFLRFCVEQAQSWFAVGFPLRCALSLTEALYQLGCHDEEFYAKVAAYVDVKRAGATLVTHSADTASTVCLALGEDLLDQYPEVHTFLLEVEAKGTAGDATLTPTAWMNLYDPAHSLVPLTEAQQECWDIIEQMVATPSSHHDELVSLAKSYNKLLAAARPDDHKYFFGVFEDKVIKADAVLRECLQTIVSSGVAVRLSAVTIAAMLHSLASIRFTYARTVKEFMKAISDEQWLEMDAVPLTQILAAMSRLSLRMPDILEKIAQRLLVLHKFLSVQDTAEAIRAFQTLGVIDTPVLQVLLTYASQRARALDEVSLTTLFASPYIHRLVRSPEVATPLLERACSTLSSPHFRRRVAKSIRKSALPRELIEDCSARLTIDSSTSAVDMLRLTGG